jgi:hypothetical protein
MTVPSTFQLQPAFQGRRPHLDIVIDRRSLRAHLARRLGTPPAQISPLSWPEAGQAVQRTAFQKFLLEAPPDFLDGRVAILVCEECSDLGCGAYSARIERDGAFVYWRDIGYQNSYDPHSLDLALADRVPTFIFAWPAYAAELRRYMP